jgi:Helix-turn-helix domain
MSHVSDPIPELKRAAAAHLAEFLRHGNGDVLAALLGTDRFRVADLRRGRLARFSLETLLRFLVRAGLSVELRVTRAPQQLQRKTRDQPSESSRTHGGSAEPTRGLEREPLQYCQAVPAVLRAVARKTPGGSARVSRLPARRVSGSPCAPEPPRPSW